MAPKAILASKNKEQRKRDRSTLGALHDISVSHTTRLRYEKTVKAFFAWVSSENIGLPNTLMLFDEVVSQYIEFLWEDGEGRYIAPNTVAALQFLKPFFA